MGYRYIPQFGYSSIRGHTNGVPYQAGYNILIHPYSLGSPPEQPTQPPQLLDRRLGTCKSHQSIPIAVARLQTKSCALSNIRAGRESLGAFGEHPRLTLHSCAHPASAAKELCSIWVWRAVCLVAPGAIHLGS